MKNIHINFKYLTLLLAILLNGGCISMSGINPNSEQLKLRELDLSDINSKSNESISWPDEKWWSDYNDNQLNEIISLATAKSPTLKIAIARVRKSNAYVNIAKSTTLPNANSEFTTGREHFTERQFIPPPWAGNTDWSNKITSNIQYDLDLWGKKQSQLKSYISESSAQSAELQLVKLALITSIIKEYIQLAKLYSLKEITLQKLEQHKHHVALVKKGLKVGLNTQLVLSQAQVLVPLTNAHIEDLEDHILLSKNKISALSGQPPSYGLSIKIPTLKLNAPIGLPNNLEANLIGRRPDLVANRLYVEAGIHGIEAAKAEFYPNINLMSFIGFQAMGFGQFIGSGSFIGSVGPAVSLPIYDGGRRRGNLEEKTASYDTAVETYNQSLLNALKEVSDQLVILKSVKQQKKQIEGAVEIALNTNKMEKISYLAGLSNYQKVIDTNIYFLDIHELLVSNQADWLTGYASLMQALGGGAQISSSYQLKN